MTIVAANWVGENTSTVGTGPLALSGAISTFCPFSVLPDGSEVYYTLQEGFNRETGIGVISNGTLTRNVQATLVAGVYTETNAPISLVGNGQVFAVINADFMTRIYNLSLDIDNSVSAAAASAQAAADSADLANDYETQSAHNAEDAAASALSASDSKVSANASKNSAASSAAAAAGSQADALASKNAAADSQADALASKNAAKTSETNSKASETASAQSATNASNSAAAALASQNAAKTSEDNAAVSRTGAGQSALAAKASENAAKTSETNSKTSEANAKTSETNAANSATAAANSAALAQQYQPNTALQLFTTFVNATSGNTMNDNLADGVYPVTADSPGAPLAVTGKAWVTHRGTACQQTWESQVAAGTANYGRKFFRTGVDNGAGGITWGDWREHVFMDLNGITKVLRGVDSTFTLGANASADMHAVGFKQAKDMITALGLKGASKLDVGTAANTVAAGDDPRLNTLDGKTGGTVSSFVNVQVAFPANSYYSPGYSAINTTRSNTYGDVNSGGVLSSQIQSTALQATFSVRESVGTSTYALIQCTQGGNKWDFRFQNNGNAYAPGTWTNSSDKRFKDNLEVISRALDKVKSLTGYIGNKDGMVFTGLLAQDLQKVLPEAVFDTGDYVLKTDINGMSKGDVLKNALGVAYGDVVGLLVEAIKELSVLLEDQGKEIEQLRNNNQP